MPGIDIDRPKRKSGEPVQIHDQSVTSKSKIYAALAIGLVVIAVLVAFAIVISK